jgi:hypothetical protein
MSAAVAENGSGRPLGQIWVASPPSIRYSKAKKGRKMQDPSEMLTHDQLAELQRRLTMLHPSSVEQVYRDAYERCAPVAGRIPKASVIQELVTAWRVLRKWGTK